MKKDCTTAKEITLKNYAVKRNKKKTKKEICKLKGKEMF
jgi:hypothetical protein